MKANYRMSFLIIASLIVMVTLAVFGIHTGLVLAGAQLYREANVTRSAPARPASPKSDVLVVKVLAAELRNEGDPWKAAPGFVYLILEVELKNVATESLDIFSFDFSLSDWDGYQQYQTSYWSGSLLAMVILSPGASVRGRLAFEVREGVSAFTLALVDSFYGPLAQVEITGLVDHRPVTIPAIKTTEN